MAYQIPPAILGAVEEGRAILFLGSGASYDALLNGSETRIPVDKIKATLSDKFLGGQFKDRQLMSVADFARNEASLVQVQTCVREMFVELEPNSFHCLVPQFRWKAIVTTNYDLVVERAYAKVDTRLQQLARVTKNGDELQNALSAQDTVPYLKLHGCINNYTDTTVPIVVDSLEYTKFSAGRGHLVTAFKEWAINHPVIFCGYSLSDENIKQILFDIGDSSQVRPLYLYVSPNLNEIESRYWTARRMAPFAGRYVDFLKAIDADIPAAKRTLASYFSKNRPTITKWIPSHEEPSPRLVQYLSEELVHVLPDAPAASKAEPETFFSGLDVSLAPIYAGLDIRRLIVDELLNSVVLDTLRSTQPKFFILQGYAGCGKSVITRRLAIESAALIDTPLVVYLPEGSVLRGDLVLELQRLVKARLYIFIDDLFEFTQSLPAFLETLSAKSVPITIFASTRTNEFSSFGDKYTRRITKSFEIGDLERPEIDALLERLSTYKLLGPLKSYEEADRVLFVEKFYGRQLLVALHEITRGSSFEDIVVDEFEKITPRQAQQIYLDICTLHQCRVGVRAGLLSRLTGHDISSLGLFLAGSLSKVVRASFDHRYRDIVYRSRHEDIARIVFDLAITSAEQRADQLRRILSSMNLDYSSDNKAFFELLKGKKLSEDFESKGLAQSIFDAAEQSSPPPSFLLHQRAILELSHKDGNLEMANDLLRRAEIEVRNEGYADSSIQHTRANLLRRRANGTNNIVEKERYRADARAILRPQLGKRGNFYPENLFGQLLLDEIRDGLEHSNESKPGRKLADLEDPFVVRLVNDLNGLVDDCLRQRPSDGPMTLLKADFLKTLGKSPNAISMLQRYCEKHTASTSVIRVLAETLIEVDRVDEAIQILRPAAIAYAGDRALNLSLAKALIRQDESENAEAILTHLRRSFSDGDSNHEARLLFARGSLLYGDVTRGREEFDTLKRLYIDGRERARWLVMNVDGSPKRYSGRISVRQFGYGFVSANDLRFDAFLAKDKENAEFWSTLNRGTPVSFSLGFTYRGPIAVDIAKLS